MKFSMCAFLFTVFILPFNCRATVTGNLSWDDGNTFKIDNLGVSGGVDQTEAGGWAALSSLQVAYRSKDTNQWVHYLSLTLQPLSASITGAIACL